MNKHAEMFGGRFLNEIDDFSCNLIVVIEEQLTIIVEPVKGQILDSDLSPLVLELASRAVDDMRDLVDRQEFKILWRVLISEE